MLECSSVVVLLSDSRSNDEVNEAYPSDLPTDITHEFHKVRLAVYG